MLLLLCSPLMWSIGTNVDVSLRLLSVSISFLSLLSSLHFSSFKNTFFRRPRHIPPPHPWVTAVPFPRGDPPPAAPGCPLPWRSQISPPAAPAPRLRWEATACLAVSRQVSFCPLRSPRLPAGVCSSPRTSAPPCPGCGTRRWGGGERPAQRRGAGGCGNAGPSAPGAAQAVTRQPTRGPSLRGGVCPALPGRFRQPSAAGAVSPLGSSGIGDRSSWCRWHAWVQAALHRNPARRLLLWVCLHPRQGRRAHHPPCIPSGAPPGTAEAEPGPGSLQRGRQVE